MLSKIYETTSIRPCAYERISTESDCYGNHEHPANKVSRKLSSRLKNVQIFESPYLTARRRRPNRIQTQATVFPERVASPLGNNDLLLS
jgi:hypothetical protein